MLCHYDNVRRRGESYRLRPPSREPSKGERSTRVVFLQGMLKTEIDRDLDSGYFSARKKKSMTRVTVLVEPIPSLGSYGQILCAHTNCWYLFEHREHR
jgi:hypothetical protein